MSFPHWALRPVLSPSLLPALVNPSFYKTQEQGNSRGKRLLCSGCTLLPAEECCQLWARVGNSSYQWESCSPALWQLWACSWAQWPPAQIRAGTQACTLLYRALCIAAGRILAHFSFCPWTVLTLHFPYHLPVTSWDCCKLSHLLCLQSWSRSQGKGRFTGPCIKQTQALWFWLQQKPEQTRRHLKCYAVSAPQGGQFFKSKAPLTVESKSSHSFPSIKGN